MCYNYAHKKCEKNRGEINTKCEKNRKNGDKYESYRN